MRVRHKDTKLQGYSEKLNLHGLGEIIVDFNDGDMASEFIRDYDVLLEVELPRFAPEGDWEHKEDGTVIGLWMDMKKAFREKKLITDNDNFRFREPLTQEEFDKGWYE